MNIKKNNEITVWAGFCKKRTAHLTTKEGLVTSWGRPEDTLKKSSHGRMLSYFEWCVAEANRLTKAGTSCCVVHNRYGYFAIAKTEEMRDHV
jgi:hypothetical protein